MAKNFEFLSRDEEIFLLTDETKTVSLKEAVSGLAMSTYATLLNLGEETDADERKRLEEKIIFQSNVLDSLSSAYSAIKNH